MYPHQACLLVALLVVTPFFTWGQHAAPASAPTAEGNFVGKTFRIGDTGAERQPASDYPSYFLFQPGGHTTFRGTRGAAERKDSPLGWRLVGDSLFLTPGPVTLEAAGKTQRSNW